MVGVLRITSPTASRSAGPAAIWFGRRLAVSFICLTLLARSPRTAADAGEIAPHANADSYTSDLDTPLVVPADRGILANDVGSPLTIVRYTAPAHGTVVVNPDGSFTYTPEHGYSGSDGFEYTVSDAVQLYTTKLPPLATLGGVRITGGGYGSSLALVPGARDEFYSLTDRGPNVDCPVPDTKIEPLPAFEPAIGKFRLADHEAILEQNILLRDDRGKPCSGRVNPLNPTSETITDLDGNVLRPDKRGYDFEGLAAMPDGTFWVSDEYGPFITHFDAEGRMIGRLSAVDGSLPKELVHRKPNGGIEGLTITPDGTTLVGIMQTALHQPDLGSTDPKTVPIVRIVTYGLGTGEVHEYLYPLDEPAVTGTAVSEIAALGNGTFLVDERDGKFPPGADKKLWKIDLAGATDVGPASTVAGARYDGDAGGLLIGGKTLESLVSGESTSEAASTLAAAGINPASKSLYLDIGGLLDDLDPRGGFFDHDKLEGLAVLDGGRKVLISNDSDFGIDGVTNREPPFSLHTKIDPTTGKQDDGEFLIVDRSRLPPVASTGSVAITVEPAQGPPGQADGSTGPESGRR